MARPQKISREQLLDHLTAVFRERGFNGASLQDMVAATGLQPASLYRHFPKGKDEMLEEVIRHVVGDFVTDVVEPMLSDRPARERIEELPDALDRFYDGGRNSCILAVAMVGETSETARALSDDAFRQWIANTEKVLVEAGLEPSDARFKAELAIQAIQGSLILSRSLEDTMPFKRTMAHLPELMLSGSGAAGCPTTH